MILLNSCVCVCVSRVGEGCVCCVMCKTAVKLLDVRDKFDQTVEKDYFYPSCLDVRQRNESLAVCLQR